MSENKQTKKEYEKGKIKRFENKIKRYEEKLKESRKSLTMYKDIVIAQNVKLEEFSIQNKNLKERVKTLDETVRKISIDLTLYKNTEKGRMKEEIKTLSCENEILRKINSKFLKLSFFEKIKLLFM